MATSTGSSKLIMEVFHTSTVSVTDQLTDQPPCEVDAKCDVDC